ncbi:MAG TPA: HEAT repeat domain-containing protein [Deltaproteobacteria bacterium]|nr:HEAT repeat domain-containing protein [Deltaproteobacteria bacterium]HIJ35663.1 HEAT repeat domain-containing protein [Deltaproteobacteria bacterium]HIJ39462.1 HEAT repeat domain-containing protein [Deltaproteobacteria bacterium]
MEEKRKGVLGFTAKVLNEAGGALVDLYDLGVGAVDKIGCRLKKAPDLGKKAREIVNEGLETIRPAGKAVKKSQGKAIKEKIKEKEEKIESLYREIGKEGVSYSEDGAPLDTEAVKSLISDVKEYEKEIKRLKDRIAELDAGKDNGDLQNVKPRQKPAFADATETVLETGEQDLSLQAAIEAAIETGLRSEVFEFASEKAKFEKVAGDLLESEMEIKILAAAELGKMKNKAAVPVLAEAVKFEDPNLTLEIVNALIEIGDSSAVKLFKDRVQDPHYRVRVACLRGLYKLAEENDGEALQDLIDALQDEHPDVRKSGATFLGWKGSKEAVPALVQGLKDEDERVIKAALSALATIRDKSAVLPLIRVLKNQDFETKKSALDAIGMITGEAVLFDLQASGEALDKATDELIDWWQKTRLGEAECDPDMEMASSVDEPGQAVASESENPPDDMVEKSEALEPADDTVREVEQEERETQTMTREELIKKLKPELIAICNDLGIECDEKLTKAELAELIVQNHA